MSRRTQLSWFALFLGVGAASGGESLFGSDRNSSGYAQTQVEMNFLGIVTLESNALLDATGKPYDAPFSGPGVRFHSTLHNLLSHTYTERGHMVIFKTDPSSEARFRKAVQQFPRFPFGYYALALALRSRRDPSWRDSAQTAVAIFEKTTAISGCNKNHFDALADLRSLLAQSPP